MKSALLNSYKNTLLAPKDVKDSQNRIIFTYHDGPKVEILGEKELDYEIDFVDSDTNETVFVGKIKNNMWTASTIRRFTNWSINVRQNGVTVAQDKFSLKGKAVKIVFDTPALGDTVAFIGAANEFQRKHDCKLTCVVFNKVLFKVLKDSYPHIQFVNINQNNGDFYAIYFLGSFTDWQGRTTESPKQMSLADLAGDVLGLGKKAFKPEFKFPTKAHKGKKYVCIATQSTAQFKYWNNPTGWDDVVKYLNAAGYEVWCVDRDKSFGTDQKMNYMPKGAIDKTKGQSIEVLLPTLQNAEFFIGLSSGISWLAWAIGKPVVMISGMSEPWSEFYTPHRVINRDVCHGCYNDEQHVFDKGNWMYCPRQKNFECSAKISSKQVIDEIKKIERNESLLAIVGEMTTKDYYTSNFQREVKVAKNYYVTHSNKDYVDVAEKLFESLKINSVCKIIYYTVNFDYNSTKFDNVIPIRINTPINDSIPGRARQEILMFKSTVCEEVLGLGDHNYCYIDSDCLAMQHADTIFDYVARIKRHPLLGRNVYDHIYKNGRGMVWEKNDTVINNEKCLEVELFRYLDVDIAKRSVFYRQSNIILFNRDCKQLMARWKEVCNDPTIVGNMEKYVPMEDETVLNTILWQEDFDENLGFIATNIPSNVDGDFIGTDRVEKFVEAFKNPKDKRYYLYDHCEIQPKNEIGNILFLHGRTTDAQYNIITEKLLGYVSETEYVPSKFPGSRSELMSKICAEFPNGKGAEIGTFQGEFSREIVSRWSGSLYMVDVWRALGAEYNDTSNHGERDIYKDAINNTVGFEDRAIMVRASSVVAANMFADESLDFVYIDANHAYDFVKQDIKSWFPKVKKGGYICGHDYIAMNWYKDPNFAENGKDKYIWNGSVYHGCFGVNPAVDEFCKEHAYIPTITNEWFGTWAIKKT